MAYIVVKIKGYGGRWKKEEGRREVEDRKGTIRKYIVQKILLTT
jgi:hypothetical protein